MSAGEVRDVQLAALDAFVKYCDDHEIRYFLAFGTLLGAVRHRGFIPWDDDIDVMMYRADLERLPEHIPSVDGVLLLDVKVPGRGGWAFPSAKICDIRTNVVPLRGAAQPHGVGIDIFPIDAMFASASASRLHLAAIALLRRMYFVRCGSVTRAGRAAWKAMLYPMLMVLLRPLPLRAIAEAWWRTAGVGPRHSKAVGVLVAAFGWDVESRVLGSGTPIMFEGRSLTAPCDWDSALRRSYGDYMTPPPIQARTSTHSVRCWWTDDSETPSGMHS
jgi:lipopolysaccharide cholinephosphotransferase